MKTYDEENYTTNKVIKSNEKWFKYFVYLPSAVAILSTIVIIITALLAAISLSDPKSSLFYLDFYLFQ